jgi:uncharacterized protein GlcG (DUF336 family)
MNRAARDRSGRVAFREPQPENASIIGCWPRKVGRFWSTVMSAMTLTLRCSPAVLGCVASLLASPAGAELLNHKDLSASVAITIAQTAIETCKANGYAVSATVVGRNGEVIVQVRGDNTGPHAFENSLRKAYTANTFRAPSSVAADRLKADPTFPLIHLNNIIANQGGLPIKVGSEVIGGAGVSGAPGGDKDEACVKAALDKVADQLK